MKRNISSAIIPQTLAVVQFPAPAPQPPQLRNYQLRLKKSLYQEISIRSASGLDSAANGTGVEG
ncbi:hypothetical protein H6F98_00205 [Microcoleus sp. FACHB-SPT15]|uniref:hypothetical protein n=1 Tax=Microcoleus sp. FACHB-SPT15 TaxID=2692830 RepID=UPI00177B7692|nr:hypothetical protein [Microcoleus sp. FACHB-SPT15]MBD1803901.1 hypothetical protein [Microcoleus sp. FACHB-SPT15]